MASACFRACSPAGATCSVSCAARRGGRSRQISNAQRLRWAWKSTYPTTEDRNFSTGRMGAGFRSQQIGSEEAERATAFTQAGRNRLAASRRRVDTLANRHPVICFDHLNAHLWGQRRAQNCLCRDRLRWAPSWTPAEELLRRQEFSPLAALWTDAFELDASARTWRW